MAGGYPTSGCCPATGTCLAAPGAFWPLFPPGCPVEGQSRGRGRVCSDLHWWLCRKGCGTRGRSRRTHHFLRAWGPAARSQPWHRRRHGTGLMALRWVGGAGVGGRERWLKRTPLLPPALAPPRVHTAPSPLRCPTARLQPPQCSVPMYRHSPPWPLSALPPRSSPSHCPTAPPITQPTHGTQCPTRGAAPLLHVDPHCTAPHPRAAPTPLHRPLHTHPSSQFHYPAACVCPPRKQELVTPCSSCSPGISPCPRGLAGG